MLSADVLVFGEGTPAVRRMKAGVAGRGTEAAASRFSGVDKCGGAGYNEKNTRITPRGGKENWT